MSTTAAPAAERRDDGYRQFWWDRIPRLWLYLGLLLLAMSATRIATGADDITSIGTLRAALISAIPIALVPESANHYSGDVTLAFSGDWTLEFIVSPEPNQSILIKTTVPIP